MRIKEIQPLFEMPYLMAGNLDWGLNDDRKNRRRTGVILHKNGTVIHGDNFGTLYRVVNIHGGEFAYISNDTHLISYYMQYRTTQRTDFGNCATQIKLWATIAPGMVGLAGDVFFNIMLADYDTLISDHVHTDDGRRFWIRRMAEAVEKGFRVGLIDHDTVVKYDGTGFQTWLNQIDGWGKSSQHRERLFYITKLDYAERLAF